MVITLIKCNDCYSQGNFCPSSLLSFEDSKEANLTYLISELALIMLKPAMMEMALKETFIPAAYMKDY